MSARRLGFLLICIAVSIPYSRTPAAAAELTEVLQRWEKACQAIDSYEFELTVEGRTVRDVMRGNRIFERPPTQARRFRLVYSAGKRQIELLRSTEGSHDQVSQVVWDGVLQQTTYRSAGRMTWDRKFVHPGPYDYESIYRMLHPESSWVEALKQRPDLSLEENDGAIIISAPEAGSDRDRPFGFRIWVPASGNSLPYRIDWLVDVQGVETVVARYETTRFHRHGDAWFPISAVISEFGRSPQKGTERHPIREVRLDVDMATARFNNRPDEQGFRFRPSPQWTRKINQRFYPGEPSRRLAWFLETAELSDQRVLVVVADRTSEAMIQLMMALEDYERTFYLAMRNYQVVGLSTNQWDVLSEYGVNSSRPDEDTLLILDSRGRLLASRPYDELTNARILDRQRLVGWLESYKPSLGDMREVLARAQREAREQEKQVLVCLGGPGCAPCLRLNNALRQRKEIVSKAYIVTKLDRRMTNADVAEVLKPGIGIPWMAILSADGEVLATSDSESGNIGFPGSPAGRSHFEQMIRNTTDRLSDTEIDELMSVFGS